jgi:phosphohistidine phosphatase
MRLYLVQHGEALSKEADPQRPLSDVGQTDVSRLARFLKAASVQASRIIHSGKKRAQQTADLLAPAIVSGQAAQAFPGLEPNDPPEEFAAQMAQWREDTVVVGHLPFLERLVALLVVGNQDELVSSFRPGTALCLERTGPGQWTIAWMIRPELLTA